MKKESFNADWTFWKASTPDEKRSVHLPHDAMQTEARIPGLKNGPLVAEFPGGDYWYEKKIPAELASIECVILEFGGVFMDSHVYLNGEEIGGHHYGYSNFFVDLSGKIKADRENCLRVFVHNSQTPNSRWYSGSGIYRPVVLWTGERQHFVPDGIRLTTISMNPAVVECCVEAVCDANTEITVQLLRDGNVAAQGKGFDCRLTVEDARLWCEQDPYLYEYRVVMRQGTRIVDEQTGPLGLRLLSWNAKSGMTVNGVPVTLRGVCVHHDNGIIGAHESIRSARRKVRRLKEGGFNAIRGSHNPASHELLQACDELGMYYVEEFFDGWYTSGSYGYVLYMEEDWAEDMRLSVRKCCNHACVIMYSIGNEVAETAGQKGLGTAAEMTAMLKTLDSSRPVTMGVNLMMNVMFQKGLKLTGDDTKELSTEDVVDPTSEDHDNKMDGSVLFNTLIGIAAAEPFIRACAKPQRSDPATKEIFGLLDVAGYNYGDVAYEKHLAWHPERILVGTETKTFGLRKRVEIIQNNPAVIGDFIWTGWDYLGECGLGVIDYGRKQSVFGKPYPCILAGCGLFDLIGHRDTLAYDAAIAWGQYQEPYIAVSPLQHSHEKHFKSMYRKTDGIHSWTFPGHEGEKTTVRVAAGGNAAELIVNGKSHGRKRLKDQTAEWFIPYSPGTIQAIAYDSAGKEWGRSSMQTAQTPPRIRLVPETDELAADGEDLCYIDITLADENGICFPIDRRLEVQVQGAAYCMAVGSAAPRTTESYAGTGYTTYYGRMLAVIRSNGESGDICVRVSGEGLEDAVVYLHTSKASEKNSQVSTTAV